MLRSASSRVRHATPRYADRVRLRADGWLVPALLVLAIVGTFAAARARADQLSAGAAKVDITSEEAGPANDRLYAKALVIKNGSTTAVIVTVDAARPPAR